MPSDRSSLFQKIPKTKYEPFSHEINSKILLSSQGLEYSNSNPGCEVPNLQFSVK
jgi:hypothetical protein